MPGHPFKKLCAEELLSAPPGARLEMNSGRFHPNPNVPLGLDDYSCPTWDLNLPSVCMGKNETSVTSNRLRGAGKRLHFLCPSVPALQFTPSPFAHQLLIFNCSFAEGLCLLSGKEGGEEGVRSVMPKSPKETL